MRKTSLFLLSVLALPAQAQTGGALGSSISSATSFAPGAQNQKPGTIMNGSSSSSSNTGPGVKMQYTTVVEPASQASHVRLFGGGSGTPTKIWHRYMVDSANRQYFGYDLMATPGPIPGHMTITISPLSLNPAEFNHQQGFTNLQAVPLPTYPPPQDVQEGDTMALTLLLSPDEKTKVVDYFQFWSIPSGGTDGNLTVSSRSGPAARDYTLDDGAPSFNLGGATVFVNGRPANLAGFTEKPGSTLWLSVPNRGRYILSLVRYGNFVRAGAIRDNTLSVTLDGQQYEIQSSGPILYRSGAWIVYMMHDPQFQSRSEGIYLGTDRLENLVSQK